MRSGPGGFLGGALSLCLLLLLGCAGGFAESGVSASAPASAPREEPAEESADGYGYAFDDSRGEASSPGTKGSGQGFGAGLATPAPASNAPEPPPSNAPASAKPGKKTKKPLLVYRATLSLGVFETKTGLETIEKLARKSGGYLVARRDTEITIRVPAKHFERTMTRITKLGDELHRDVQVSDVTAEYRDLEIRLDSARAVRARLQELLAKAANVSEALEVEKELERVSVEIETLTGRLKLLRELVAFSTITVRFEARPTDQVDSRVALPFPWLEELGLPNLLSL